LGLVILLLFRCWFLSGLYRSCMDLETIRNNLDPDRT
jgi:hypothetical protein